MNEQNNENERITELKLFNTIMHWEHDNKYTKQYTDKQMQDRIKKLIQSSTQTEGEE